MFGKKKGIRREGGATIPGALLRGMLLTILFSAVMLLLATGAVYMTPDPTRWVSLGATVAMGAAALFCGHVTARLRGGQGLLCGLCAGGIFLLLLLALSLLATPLHPASPLRIFLCCLSVPLLSMLGGLRGGRPRTRRRH